MRSQHPRTNGFQTTCLTLLLLCLTLLLSGCSERSDTMDESMGEIMMGETAAVTLTASLAGSAETDEDGTGSVSVEIDPEAGEVCYEIEVSNIEEPSAAHIHRGAAGQSGGVAVNFNVPDNGLEGCVSDVGGELAADIIDIPGDFYVNVHNAPFPGGAIRGQLADN